MQYLSKCPKLKVGPKVLPFSENAVCPYSNLAPSPHVLPNDDLAQKLVGTGSEPSKLLVACTAVRVRAPSEPKCCVSPAFEQMRKIPETRHQIEDVFLSSFVRPS